MLWFSLNIEEGKPVWVSYVRLGLWWTTNEKLYWQSLYRTGVSFHASVCTQISQKKLSLGNFMSPLWPAVPSRLVICSTCEHHGRDIYIITSFCDGGSRLVNLALLFRDTSCFWDYFLLSKNIEDISSLLSVGAYLVVVKRDKRSQLLSIYISWSRRVTSRYLSVWVSFAFQTLKYK